jgi:hypothetical protein
MQIKYCYRCTIIEVGLKYAKSSGKMSAGGGNKKKPFDRSFLSQFYEIFLKF